MARAGSLVYEPLRGGAAHQAAVTSTGVADPKTIPVPAGAAAAYITVETTAARVTFDGETPDATHGLVLATGILHYVPFVAPGGNIKFLSAAAGNSVVNVLWLE